jgi:hypothetical protein
MYTNVLLFLIGAVGIVLIARLYAVLWPPAFPPQPLLGRCLFLATVIIISAALAWLAFGCLQQAYSFDSMTFARWIVLGDGVGLLLGILAGTVLAASINAIERWGPNPDSKWATAAALAAGPGLAVVALFILGVPGIRQSIGLTSIKAGGVEVELAPPSVTAPPNINSLYLPQADTSGLKGYTPWFNVLWPMVGGLDYEPLKGFFKQGYFNREFNYLHLIDAIDLPLTTQEPGKLDDDSKVAIYNQQEFLHWLRPVVGCGGYYHKFFPAISDVRRQIGAWNDSLTALEIDLEKGSENPGDTDVKGDLYRRRAELPKDANGIVNTFKNAIPAVLLKAKSDETQPSPSDCRLPAAAFDPQRIQIREVQPPYLAMFLAESYAALGDKAAGLKVLNGWLTYYENLIAKNPKAPTWLLDRAYLEYGIVQEADEPVPTTYPEWFYLNKMVGRFKDWKSLAKGYHWQVDLENNGATCGSAQAHRDEEEAGAKAAVMASQPNSPWYDELGAEARLNTLYSNTVQRLLLAAIATKSGINGEFVDDHEESLASQLLKSAERCLAGENNDAREFRIAWNRAAGGMLLGRRAADGVSGGLVTKSKAQEMRKTALRALLEAHAAFLHNERKDEKEAPDGPIRVEQSDWEIPRRLIERQIIDLEASLTN